MAKSKTKRPMTHAQRLALIHQELPVVRVLPPSYPWGGTFVNDYFGEHLDAWRADQKTKYEGALARELRALVEQEDNELVSTGLDDSTEVRQFIESQTRSRRRASGAWS